MELHLNYPKEKGVHCGETRRLEPQSLLESSCCSVSFYVYRCSRGPGGIHQAALTWLPLFGGPRSYVGPALTWPPLLCGSHSYVVPTLTWLCSYMAPTLLWALLFRGSRSFVAPLFCGPALTWLCSYVVPALPWAPLFCGSRSYTAHSLIARFTGLAGDRQNHLGSF